MNNDQECERQDGGRPFTTCWFWGGSYLWPCWAELTSFTLFIGGGGDDDDDDASRQLRITL